MCVLAAVVLAVAFSISPIHAQQGQPRRGGLPVLDKPNPGGLGERIITQSILRNSFRRATEIGSIDDKVVSIARPFIEEMHLSSLGRGRLA